MARLRVRVELSRGGQGVPLHKLAHVIDEALKFFQMLGEDAGIAPGGGEWLGVDFDRDSLNFTAEYVGPVTPAQVEAFHAGFAGTTSLRRATIAQFARITETIGEEELVGFGLYDSDTGAETREAAAGEARNGEPTEWRCISRRDALRMTEEIDLLASEEVAHDSHLPAVRDPALAARLFGERRDRGLEHAKWVDYVRGMEAGLSTRLVNVEGTVQRHSEILEDMRARTVTAEESFRHLLTAVENFCNQAAQQIERLPQPALPAPVMPSAPLAAASWWRPAPALAAGCIFGILLASVWVWMQSSQSPSPTVASAAGAAPVRETAVVETPERTAPTTAVPRPPATASTPSSTPASTPAPTASAAATPASTVQAATPDGVETAVVRAVSGPTMRLDLAATEPTWTALADAEGNRLMAQLLLPGSPRSFQLETAATLRVGNAGGIEIRLDGKPIGPVGPRGGVKQVEFKDGAFKILDGTSARPTPPTAAQPSTAQ